MQALTAAVAAAAAYFACDTHGARLVAIRPTHDVWAVTLALGTDRPEVRMLVNRTTLAARPE